MKHNILQNALVATLLVAGSAMLLLTLNHSMGLNGYFSFPLDDPWIHLQFAKNLHDHGSFSYYKNEMVTSGSTSPLYTLILSAGFFITQDEMILSYLLGAVFFLLAIVFIYLSAKRIFPGSPWIAVAAPALIIFEPHLQWAALSGMETTFFIFLLMAAYYWYLEGRKIAFSVFAGLLIWARPEAILFYFAVLTDIIYNHYRAKPPGQKKRQEKQQLVFLKEWLRPGICILAFVALYFLFNLFLSGSIFPNTYSAKIKYYSGGGKNFPLQVFNFLTDGHFRYFSIAAAFGVIGLVYSVAKRRSAVLIVPFVWTISLGAAYWSSLPYLYQEGRYLMPLIPAYIIVGVEGVRLIAEFLGETFEAVTETIDAGNLNFDFADRPVCRRGV